MTSNFLRAAFVAALTMLPLAAQAEDHSLITIQADTLYPESVSWSEEQQVFFVGSVAHGRIGKVDKTGAYSPFAEIADLPSTFGIHVDDTHRHLWVVSDDFGTGQKSNDATKGKLALVVALDSHTGKELARYDLTTQAAPAHGGNDVAVDAPGNAYITDSFAHVVYKIDTAGTLSTFAKSPLFETGEGFGLNGIAAHSDGYLLVGTFNSGEIFRIDLANPSKVERVDAPKLLGMDGFTLKSPTELVAAISGLAGDGMPARAIELVSTDGWKSATIKATKAAVSTFPASVTKAGDDVWVLNTRLDTLLDPKAAKISTFYLQNFDLSK